MYISHRLHRLQNFFTRPVVQYLSIFLISWGLFLWYQWSPNFPDPDSFYHLKVTELLRDYGVVRDFPWAQYTVLTRYYIDQHFFYHVFLIPFISFLQPFLGLKVATAFLGSLLSVIFFLFLRKARVSWPFLWALLLILTIPFTFRLSLAKAVGFSLVWLFVGLLFAFEKRKILLCVWSFFYVWSYGGFLLLPILTSVLCFFRIMFECVQYRHVSWDIVKQPLTLFAAVVSGTALGVLIHPYFPKNLTFYWHQLIQIGVVNYRDTIGVGGEWYPYEPSQLIARSILLSLFVVVALIWFVWHIRKQHIFSWTTFVWMIFFLLLTFKSRRYVEYYVPFATLFAATVGSQILQQATSFFWQHFQHSWKRLDVWAGVLGLAYVAVIFPAVIGRDIRSNLQDTHDGLPYTKFRASATWLEEHSDAGDIVLHSDWDDFPMLFYWNTKNFYIVGLDPTFMYNNDRERYWKWVEITTGKLAENVYETVHDTFRARYIHVEKDHTAMMRLVEREKRFVEVYADDEVVIFAVP
ncbi:MAG: hypothetical protein A3B74_03230 [Candidatus Kerfeldbacteria bacterium RIFCSPHIGHO2_02_FULL_42_14]|uniref:Glycosyltransferase RgtA/B/C/D-like domain-containing protein n=1 Tax=Candidatus Kerfeldbacteria bacterium RIFCSPHIGHO2_02_FULL_42_14 TaxID=1798540 RepID=A0A1G2AQJ8_9BACT|nr:MAG: hypothetical protein A3B74_03230 [Candidatus Kerfeldbacteria bacterium RIFCSPHIGHO2_02_FULL_42_14]OGY80921.1 MAG: hypothetical protein A3E60_03145 [Candidatus Kerfeldbacteria bacterium RIFCSPHIGHO2_12_FULL_42_13]OGY84154.1 MAG: hypothetical protein A3I91_01545 [Candidatus Kerfeldbacteria bacterium RIFCSPLOWO2_02_FULL_42_19]OGY87284.1 MAG: hypothetical protein A3G01_03015 [Candidatus Kerfeldbacteria bacterium RIFCSPLOWO2_12_FULL_43_9]